VLPALATDTARNVGGIRSMPEVCPAGCCQGGLQLFGPFRVGLGEPPNLVGGQAQITERRPERLIAVDRIQELLAHSGRESLLRLAPKACPRRVVCASRHRLQSHPSSQRVSVPCAASGPRRRPSGSVSSRTLCSSCTVHGGRVISPRESHRRMTGGVTLHTAAAWRTEVTLTAWSPLRDDSWVRRQ
jgi:hypothetical protein